MQHGISDSASWHARYKHSACVPQAPVKLISLARVLTLPGHRYVYAGGFPYDLTEGDLLAVFSQVRERQRPALRQPY